MTWCARGSTVVVRQHRFGRFRAVTPMVVAEDGPDRTLLYVPRGTVFMAPADATGAVTRTIRDEVGVTPDPWRDHAALFIVPRGAGFAVIARWGASFDDFTGFYVNVQEPLRRTAIGFDSMDQTLDVIIGPDLSVRVKDADELDEAAADGFFSAAEVAEIHASAARATRMVLAGEPPFDEPWHAWRPDPAWPVPRLPAGWADEPLSPSPWAAGAEGPCGDAGPEAAATARESWSRQTAFRSMSRRGATGDPGPGTVAHRGSTDRWRTGAGEDTTSVPHGAASVTCEIVRPLRSSHG